MTEPVIEERTVVESDSTAWIGAVFGVLVVLALVFYFSGYVPLHTASSTTITTATEKVVPPASPDKPAKETTTKTEATTQSQ